MATRRVPGPKSAAEESLKRHLRADRAPPYKREYRFHETRRWRFDFAWPDYMLAVEVDGLTLEGGRHQRFKGVEGDNDKINTAQILGWMVLRFSQNQVKDGTAINTILLALSVRKPITPAEPAAVD